MGVRYFYSVKAVLNAESSSYTSEGGSALLDVYTEVENNGPMSWASGSDWYYGGDSVLGVDYFEVKGGYSGSYQIYNPAVYKNFDYDVFKISLSKGNSITFTKNSGNMGSGGLAVSINWLDSWGLLGGHAFASGGETYTPVFDAGVTISHAYIEVDIPSGATGSNYDFTFSISR